MSQDTGDQVFMPEVDILPDIEEVFEKVRKKAGGEAPSRDADSEQRYVVLVTPGRMMKLLACPVPGAMRPELVAAAEQMMSSKVKRNIAVIGFVDIKQELAGHSRQIPFLGFLVGLAYIGHAIWVFEGHPSALAAGCREADVLLVDGGMVPFLQPDWKEVAGGAMRHREILVHDRATYQITRV